MVELSHTGKSRSGAVPYKVFLIHSYFKKNLAVAIKKYAPVSASPQ
jgi:hypothetical protein